MKISYKNCFYLFTILLLWSCENEDLNPQIDPIFAPVAVVTYTDDVNESFIDATDIPNSTFAFNLTSEDFGHEEARVESVVVNLTYNGNQTINIGEFPQSELDGGKRIAYTVTEAASLLGIPVGEVKLADVFTFSFSVKTVSGAHYQIYNNNICNLIRVIGNCEVDFMVLNPAAIDASINTANSVFSLSEIEASGDDAFQLDLLKRDFSSPLEINSIEIGIIAPGSSDIEILKSVTGFPEQISIGANELASFYGMNIEDFTMDEAYKVVLTYQTASSSFRTFGSGNCGKTLASSIVHPLHLPWLNPQGTSISPPPTPVEGSCEEISILITE